MARLKKEEVIQLYKIPNSMDAKEICRYSGFFTSVAVINKYLNEARASGIITPEDDNVFKKRQSEKEEETYERNSIVYEQSLKKLFEFKSKETIANEIGEEFHIKVSDREIRKMYLLAIERGILTKERYEEIIHQIRMNSIRETNKKKKQMKLEKEQNR